MKGIRQLPYPFFTFCYHFATMNSQKSSQNPKMGAKMETRSIPMITNE